MSSAGDLSPHFTEVGDEPERFVRRAGGGATPEPAPA